MLKRTGFILFLLCFTSWISGCSTADVDENDPVALMEEAEKDIAASRYQIALDKLRMVKNRFPYSPKSAEAHLRIADVYFLQESFGEAALQYESFRDLYPKHTQTSYALFRIGKSYFFDTPENIARDLTSAQRAVEAYDEYLSRFPAPTSDASTEQLEEAKKDHAEMLNRLAKKEFYIGEFYWKWKDYASAKTRLEKLIQLYPKSSSVKSAEALLKKISDKLQ